MPKKEMVNGTELKSLRQKTGLQQKHIAELFKITRGYLGDVENGKRLISKDKYDRIHEYLSSIIPLVTNEDIQEQPTPQEIKEEINKNVRNALIKMAEMNIENNPDKRLPSIWDDAEI